MSGALAWLGIDGLERPDWLVVLAGAGLVAVALAARRQPSALPWPAVAEAAAAGARRADPVRIAALCLRGGALVVLACVLAGPVAVRRAPAEPGRGLDLVLVIDTSGSMRALDAEIGGESRTRLDLARQVVARFAERRVVEGDRVGLIVFGETVFTQCPLTSDVGLLAASLGRLEPGIAGEATALGDALALAVKRVSGVTKGSATGGDSAAGRVVVLLTDGHNNAGALPPDLAAELAAAASVRVYTVAIGSEGREVPMARAEGAAGRGLHFERHDVDFATGERIAAATGGRSYRARRASDLEAVYAQIDALERAPRSFPPRVRRSERPEPLLALAGGLLLLEIATARGLRRRLP